MQPAQHWLYNIYTVRPCLSQNLKGFLVLIVELIKSKEKKNQDYRSLLEGFGNRFYGGFSNTWQHHNLSFFSIRRPIESMHKRRRLSRSSRRLLPLELDRCVLSLDSIFISETTLWRIGDESFVMDYETFDSSGFTQVVDFLRLSRKHTYLSLVSWVLQWISGKGQSYTRTA